jgi:anti-sigma factor RsiW
MKTGESADTRETCHKHVALLGAFLDGALDAANTLELDEHLAHCESCRERVELDRAVRGSLKKAMRAVSGGDAMRERMLAAMAAATEDARSSVPADASDATETTQAPHVIETMEEAAASAREERVEERAQALNAESATGVAERVESGGAEVRSLRGQAGRLASWRTLVPIATAAALALVWNGVAQTAPQGAHQTDVMRAGFGHDPLADLVAQHSQPPLPPERTDPKDLRGFERWVGVPVHAPRFRGENARLVGGRVTTVHHERAAMLQYEVGQGAATQRVSVFIYDPHKIQIGHDRLTPRAIGTSEIRVGREDGYSVAVRAGADAGVGYTVVSDLDPERSAELAVFTEDD